MAHTSLATARAAYTTTTTDHRTAPDGRLVHIWRGRDRTADTAALADTLATAIPGLVNHEDSIAQLDEDGKLVGVGLNALRELIDRYVCEMRIVNHGGKYEREYFAYAFPTPQHPGPPTQMTGIPQRVTGSTEPDATVLMEVYQHELPYRLPKVRA